MSPYTSKPYDMWKTKMVAQADKEKSQIHKKVAHENDLNSRHHLTKGDVPGPTDYKSSAYVYHGGEPKEKQHYPEDSQIFEHMKK